MPPVSKAQARLFRAIAAGRATKRTGLSKALALEMVKGHPTRGLPERKKRRRRRRR
jgi:hypothetical protein